MKRPSYVIVHAQTLPHLQSLVNEGIAEGYAPVGGPFNGSAFNPPHPTLAQAMVLAEQKPTKPFEQKATKGTKG
jgi:poly-gamma-glutamate capsule biosynthesis protein CapA/YwtB (metallophosphatase superfamily)